MYIICTRFHLHFSGNKEHDRLKKIIFGVLVVSCLWKLLGKRSRWKSPKLMVQKFQTTGVWMYLQRCKIIRNDYHINSWSPDFIPIESMGLVYLPTFKVDFYAFHVGKYTVRPMDPTSERAQQWPSWWRVFPHLRGVQNAQFCLHLWWRVCIL